jgi:hypothetical protein
MQQAALKLWAKDMKANYAEAQKTVHARARTMAWLRWVSGTPSIFFAL